MMNPAQVRDLKKSAALPVFLGVLMLLLPYGVVSPLLESLSQTEMALDNAAKSARKTLRQGAVDRAMGANLAEMKKDLAAVQQWLPAESNLPNVIDAFQGIAQTMSIRLLSVSYKFADGQSAGFPPKIAIIFNLEGSYANVRGFLEALEYFPLPVLPVEITANDKNAFAVEILHLVRL